MLLREYLYVDIDKVSGFASQLYDGVPEKAVNLSARQKKLEGDFKVIKGSFGVSSEGSIERGLGDSVFKDLETDLESLNLLIDRSAELAKVDSWDKIADVVKPGHILRVTAPGTLFHPAQLSEALVGIVTAAYGLGELGVGSDRDSTPPEEKSQRQRGNHQRPSPKSDRSAHDFPFPEDRLPAGETVPVMRVPREQLSGIIKVVRGMFGEGVHLHLRPLGLEGPTISARLEEGRRYLDSTPEVLFSRYGLSSQEWTVVGVVGQLGSEVHGPGGVSIVDATNKIQRARVVDLVGSFLGQTAGLVDLPQAPGFSIVPIAVYRVVGGSLS